MVGITKSRWLATGLSTLMAAGLVVGSGAVAFAQDEEECPVAVVTGEIPDLTGELGRKPKVGLVMKSLANEFFMQMDAGARAFAADNADLFDFETVGMANETDFAAQVEAVENYIAKQFDVIVIAPADSRAMVEPLAQAMEAGIVVVNIDVALDETAKEEAGVKLAFFGPDNRAGAKMAGDELGKLLGEGGKVVILEGNQEADNAVQRKLGFDDSVAEYGLDLLESRTAKWELELANGVMTDFLTKYPDVQGVMAANDSMALGVVRALDAAGMTDKVKVVGFDNIPAVQDLIKQGKMLATIDQFGPDMAKNCIETGFRMMSGEDLKGWIKTPVQLVTINELK